jgi:integrase
MLPDMRGFGSVLRQKGSRFLWIQYWKNGKRFRESSKSDKPKVALDLLKRRVAEANQANLALITVTTLVEDLLTWYSSENVKPKFAEDVRSRWRLHLQPFFGNIIAGDVGTGQMRSYRAKRIEAGAAHATVNRELQVLRKAYKLALSSEPPKVLRMPTFKLPKENNARKVFIADGDLEKLRQAAAAEGLWARTFIEMAFMFGWRRGELEGLRVGNIRLSDQSVRIEDSKNHEPREVPLTPTLLTLLEPLVAGRNPDERLWPVKSTRSLWKRICKAAGLVPGKAGIVLHDARRSSAKIKRFAGVSESVIMDLHGWKTPAMFRRYGIIDPADRMQALTKHEGLERQRAQERRQREMFQETLAFGEGEEAEEANQPPKKDPSKAAKESRRTDIVAKTQLAN